MSPSITTSAAYLPSLTKVAGRDGFWLHRFLEAHGIQNFVMDSASIEVNRRKKRAKTDRLDFVKRIGSLARQLAGEERLNLLAVPE